MIFAISRHSTPAVRYVHLRVHVGIPVLAGNAAHHWLRKPVRDGGMSRGRVHPGLAEHHRSLHTSIYGRHRVRQAVPPEETCPDVTVFA